MKLNVLEDTLPGRLLAIRKDQKLSQEEFGKRIGVSRSAICNYEVGERPISNQVILAVCREFGVSEIWLRHGSGETYEPEKDGAIECLIRKYHCSKFEGDFLKTYFQMTEEERSAFVHCAYRLFAPLMEGLKGKNPFADYFSVTYGVDSAEATDEGQRQITEPENASTKERLAAYKEYLETGEKADGKSSQLDSSCSNQTGEAG